MEEKLLVSIKRILAFAASVISKIGPSEFVNGPRKRG
jgi:hypothetical protein